MPTSAEHSGSASSSGMREICTGVADAGGNAQQAFGDFEQAGHLCAASGEDAACAEGLENSALAEIVAEQVEQLAGAGLEDLGDDALADEARPSRRRELDLALGDGGDDGVAVFALEPLGLGDGDVEAEGEVVGEVVAADGNDRGVGDGALEEDDEFGRARADVDEADAEFALVGGDGGLGGGDGFEDGFGDFKAGAVGAGDDALQRLRRSKSRDAG